MKMYMEGIANAIVKNLGDLFYQISKVLVLIIRLFMKQR
jgi:hypothetical protein